MSERRDGRRQGQGWFLENKAHQWLLTRNRIVDTRVDFWGQEVDIVGLNLEGERPERLLGSCKDWFQRTVITPSTLWRLIALAMTARAEPLLIHNHRAELTDTAQHIAEQWRVRLATDRDVLNDAPLPEPERPPNGFSGGYAPILNTGLSYHFEHAPDYYGHLDSEKAYNRLDIDEER